MSETLKFQNTRAPAPAPTELLFAVPQRAYVPPRGQVEVAEVATLTQNILDGKFSFQDALAAFDALLGLRADNIVAFETEFCGARPGLKEAVQNALYALAALCYRQNSAAQNGSLAAFSKHRQALLMAAEFLAPYVYVLSENGAAYFIGPYPLLFQERGQRPIIDAAKNDVVFGQAIAAALRLPLEHIAQGKTASYAEEPNWKSTGAPTTFIPDRPGDAFVVTDVVLEWQKSFVLPEKTRLENAPLLTLPQDGQHRFFVSWHSEEKSADILQLSNSNSPTPTLHSAQVYADKTVALQAAVTDEWGRDFNLPIVLTVQNTENEAPNARLSGPSSTPALGEVSFAAKPPEGWASFDLNPTDTPSLSWTVHEAGAKNSSTLIAKGQGATLSFTAPDVKKRANYTIELELSDGHDKNNETIVQKTLTVTPRAMESVTATERSHRRDKELQSLADVFKTPVTSVGTKEADKELSKVFLNALLITDPKKPDTYDLGLFVDQSGSMNIKLSLLAPTMREALRTIGREVAPGGLVRITIFTYGNETLTQHLRTPWITVADPAKLDQLAVELQTKIDDVAAHIAKNNLNLETLWHAIWDAWEGPDQVDWDGGDNGEVRFVALTDEAVHDAENVTTVPLRTKPFDRGEAEAFLKAHPTTLRIVELSDAPYTAHDIIQLIEQERVMAIAPALTRDNLTPEVEAKLTDAFQIYENKVNQNPLSTWEVVVADIITSWSALKPESRTRKDLMSSRSDLITHAVRLKIQDDFKDGVRVNLVAINAIDPLGDIAAATDEDHPLYQDLLAIAQGEFPLDHYPELRSFGEHQGFQRQAIALLGDKLGPKLADRPEAIKALTAAMQNAGSLTGSFGELFGNPDSQKILIILEVLLALQKVGPGLAKYPDCVAVLTDLVADEDTFISIREAAIKALGQIGPDLRKYENATMALLKAATDVGPAEVQAAAMQALKDIGLR